MTSGSATGNGGAARTDAFGWRFVAPLFVGSALNPVNSSVIATALVPIAVALHVSVGRTALLVSALYLASAIAQPTAGKLAEVFGPRRVFLTGIVIVLAGGVLGGLSQDLAMLVAARVLIGIGTSAVAVEPATQRDDVRVGGHDAGRAEGGSPGRGDAHLHGHRGGATGAGQGAPEQVAAATGGDDDIGELGVAVAGVGKSLRRRAG